MKRIVTGIVLLTLVLSLDNCQWTARKFDFLSSPGKLTVAPSRQGKISTISLDELFPKYEAGKVFFLDARPAYFYRKGHIPGAQNLYAIHCDPGIAAMKPMLDRAIASGKILVTYCTGFGCMDARTLAHHLSYHGYPATIFGGGWRDWKSAGLPIESTFQSPSSLPTPKTP